MVKTNTTILREGRQFEVDAGTVTTGTLTDSDDSSAWETLRELGYESGDFIGLYTFGGGNQDATTSSSSYSASNTGAVLVRTVWDELFPSSVTAHAFFSGQARPDTDQLDVRVRNTTDGETIVETTGITGGQQVSTGGPTSYTPTTTSSGIEVQFQIRNNDDSTSVDWNDPLLVLGVKL